MRQKTQLSTVLKCKSSGILQRALTKLWFLGANRKIRVEEKEDNRKEKLKLKRLISSRLLKIM